MNQNTMNRPDSKVTHKTNFKKLAKAHWRDKCKAERALKASKAELARCHQLLANNFICLACGKGFPDKAAVCGHVGACLKHDAGSPCALVDVSIYEGAHAHDGHRRLLASIKGQPRYEALIYRDGGIWCSHCQKKVSPARPYRLKQHCQSVRHCA